jgi:cephalosporin-C deacetylase
MIPFMKGKMKYLPNWDILMYSILAKRIRAEVLMATGLMDEICPPSTQFAAYNKIVHLLKKMVIYPDYGHENLPGFNDMTFRFLSEL